jgi:hypothetical protein
MVAKFICNKIREDMRTAEENSDLQAEINLRKRAESQRIDDENTVNRNEKSLGPWMTDDEESVKIIIELRPIMERWAEYAAYEGGGVQKF